MSGMNFAETNMQTGEKRPPSGQASRGIAES